MHAHLENVKIIRDHSGHPTFVQIPYDEYVAMSIKAQSGTPISVIRAVAAGTTPVRAWREYLGLSQGQVAKRMGITQPGFAQHERRDSNKLTLATREKIAAAFGISIQQLEL